MTPIDTSSALAPTVVEKPQPPQRVPASPDSSAAANSAGATPAAGVDFSTHAHVLSTLHGLSGTHPDQFKQAAAQYAGTLKAQAAHVGGAHGTHLARLARKFDAAARTGSLAGLHPGGARAGSAQAASAQAASARYDTPIPEALRTQLPGPPQVGVVPPAPTATVTAAPVASAAPAASKDAPAADDAAPVVPSSDARRYIPPA